MRIASLLALLAGCSVPRRPEPPVASCSDLGCLAAHEAQVIELAGTFVAPANPKRKGQQLYRLVLDDGTAVVLRAKLATIGDGARLTVHGRIYVKAIPERYGIIQRTSDPYLLDVTVAR